MNVVTDIATLLSNEARKSVAQFNRLSIVNRISIDSFNGKGGN
jgi:hypothetical protein